MKQLLFFLKKYHLDTFLKFSITGLANTGIDFLVFWLLTSFFSVNIYMAQFLGYSAGMLNSYMVNRSWTFHSKERIWSSQLVRFLLTNLLTLALSLFALQLAIEYFLLSRFLAKIVVTVFTLVINFVISRLWVFKKQS